MRFISFCAITILSIGALSGTASFAEDGALKIDGDLMIHPNQVADFFNITGDQIRTSASWNWPVLHFTKPYRTEWNTVQAHGPFDIQFDTSGLKNQELAFTLNWSDPVVSVGEFEIHDTIVRHDGGANIIIHLDGTCTNMEVQIPKGQWAVKGKMRWDYVNHVFAVTWENFNFQMNAAVMPQVNLGQCQGQLNLIKQLHDTVVALTSDQAWLQDVLKQGIQDWMQTTLGNLQTQLLTSREVKIKDQIKVVWTPSELTTLTGGLLHVAGDLVIAKVGSKVGADKLARNYDPKILGAVSESGFVLPKDTLQRILTYMYANGELQYRLLSTTLSSFQSLMSSRFLQFFVWPDLMNFPTTTQFYFDLATDKAPQLSNGQMLTDGGSAYDFSMPIVAHQWAPLNKAYVPYIDFRAPASGQMLAQIKDGVMTLQIQCNDLSLSDSFRPEFAISRPENTWIATSILSSKVRDYLNETPFTIAVPSWRLSPQLSLGMRDLQVWKQTFRIPLQFIGP